jgi:hypothetical protein
MKKYFWKAKNMNKSNIPIDESVRNKKINIVLLINEMKT